MFTPSTCLPVPDTLPLIHSEAAEARKLGTQPQRQGTSSVYDCLLLFFKMQSYTDSQEKNR